MTLLFVETNPKDQTAESVTTDADLDSQEKTILLVEDETGIRDVCKFALEQLGYQVVTAADGDSAREILKTRSKLDLFVSDLVMPGSLSGEALVRFAKETSPNLAILLISGYATDAPKEYSFLSKPFTLSELQTAVRKEIENT